MIRKARLEQISRAIQGSVMTNRSASTRESRPVEEIRIPVPWGHIAGKWWNPPGPEPKPLVIAIHGWLENASSWDLFAPRLESDSLLCVDLPGHGLSSPLPPSFNVNVLVECVSILRRIQLKYSSEPVHLIGHSLGSQICFYFASLYPESVASYFGIDGLIHCFADYSKRVDTIAKLAEKKILLENFKTTTFTLDEIKDKFSKMFKHTLVEQTLFERGTRKTVTGRYTFAFDQRYKMHNFTALDSSQVLALAEQIRCHVRLFSASRVDFFYKFMKDCPEIVDMIANKARSFKLTSLDGGHHLHIELPEQLASLYGEFRKEINL